METTAAVYSVTLAPVPEPETYALLLSGWSLMGAVARRREQRLGIHNEENARLSSQAPRSRQRVPPMR